MLLRRIGYASMVVTAILGAGVVSGADFPTSRDLYKWPFAQNSIWNMPVGSNAVLVSGGLKPFKNFSIEEDIIIMTPEAPLVDCFKTTAGWSSSVKRCDAMTGTLLDRFPIPASFTTDPGYVGSTPNHSSAILMPDKKSIKQNQPFHRCGVNGPAVTQYIYPTVDITGDGIEGAHGGSGLSSIGGAVRVGELVPGGVIRHALRVVAYAINYYYSSNEPDGKKGYRWPSVKADGYASTTTYSGTNPELQNGSLLVLQPSFDKSKLETEPGRIIAQAMIDYGAYVCDDAAWDAFYFACEWGPAGRVLNEFKSVWGYNFQATSGSWYNDMIKIFTSTYVVTNNSPTSIGGGGTPRVPLAPPYGTVETNQSASGISPIPHRPPSGLRIRLHEGCGGIRVDKAGGGLSTITGRQLLSERTR